MASPTQWTWVWLDSGSWWCHSTISTSVVPFCPCLLSFPAPGSFPMSWLFASGGQSIGASASASVLPMNLQDRFPLKFTGLISLQSKGLSRLLSGTTIRKHQFFGTQPLWSHSHICRGFPAGLDGKGSACNSGELGSIPGPGSSHFYT